MLVRRPSSPLTAAGGVSIDVFGSRWVRVGPGVPAKQGDVQMQMMSGHGSEIGNFHRRRMDRHRSNASSRHTGSHSFGIAGTAAVMTTAAAGSAHTGGHIHHLEVHVACLNRRQTHPCSHKDCKQQNQYLPDQRMRHGNLIIGAKRPTYKRAVVGDVRANEMAASRKPGGSVARRGRDRSGKR